MKSILCLSPLGEDIARRLAEDLGISYARLKRGEEISLINALWPRSSALIFVGSLEAAIRTISPFITREGQSPGIITVTEDGEIVVPLIDTFPPEKRDLATVIAEVLGARRISTKSGERSDLKTPDYLAERWGWKIVGTRNLDTVVRRLSARGHLLYWLDRALSTPPLPPGYDEIKDREKADILISPFRYALAPEQIQMIPPMIAAKVIICGEISREMTISAIKRAIGRSGLHSSSLSAILTDKSEGRMNDLFDVTAALNVPLEAFDKPGSITAEKQIGEIHSTDIGDITLYFNYRNPPGRLSILGSVDGENSLYTLKARNAAMEADIIMGPPFRVEGLPPAWLRGKGLEESSPRQNGDSVKRAVKLALRGYRVALIWDGDSLLSDITKAISPTTGDDVEIELIPAISPAAHPDT